MRTVASLIKYIEERFVVGESTKTSRSVTGEPYVVIGAQANGFPSIPGTVDEGADREMAFDQETACMQALGCFQAYAQDRTGILYWRVRPMLERHTHSHFSNIDNEGNAIPAVGDFVKRHDRPHFVVYMRCLISQRDPLKVAV